MTKICEKHGWSVLALPGKHNEYVVYKEVVPATEDVFSFLGVQENIERVLNPFKDSFEIAPNENGEVHIRRIV